MLRESTGHNPGNVGQRALTTVHSGYSAMQRVLSLLGKRLARAAHLRREVLELGQAVLHRQDGRLVVDVHAGSERERRDRRGVHVDQAPLRVARQHVAAAGLAPLAIAPVVLVVLADPVGSLRDLDCLVLPERERVDGPGRPASAGNAVAEAGALGIAFDDDLDSAAVARAFERLRILAH